MGSFFVWIPIYNDMPEQDRHQVRVCDYVDAQVHMLASMYKKRLAGYAALYPAALAGAFTLFLVFQQTAPRALRLFPNANWDQTAS